jgi:hypothetical protein
MQNEAHIETETKSECRALVPLTVTAGDSARGHSLAEAPFIVQLSANVKGFSLYRAKRREQPEIGAQRYRTTIADALACRPHGQKLNYCA